MYFSSQAFCLEFNSKVQIQALICTDKSLFSKDPLQCAVTHKQVIVASDYHTLQTLIPPEIAIGIGLKVLLNPKASIYFCLPTLRCEDCISFLFLSLLFSSGNPTISNLWGGGFQSTSSPAEFISLHRWDRLHNTGRDAYNDPLLFIHAKPLSQKRKKKLL